LILQINGEKQLQARFKYFAVTFTGDGKPNKQFSEKYKRHYCVSSTLTVTESQTPHAF